MKKRFFNKNYYDTKLTELGHEQSLQLGKTWKDKHNIELDVVFSGADKGNLDYIKSIVRTLDLTKQVYFLGFIDNDDVVYKGENDSELQDMIKVFVNELKSLAGRPKSSFGITPIAIFRNIQPTL